jgi:hypothetical protein
MNRTQVNRMLKVFKKHLPLGSRHVMHVGVMTSFKVMNGLLTKFEKAFPKTNDISGIFSSDEVYNCLHYVDYDGQSDFATTLAKVIELGGIGIHAVQLDMVWPDPVGIMDGVHRSRKNVEVILQIGEKAFTEIDDEPEELAERLDDYKSVIHRVLLDKSMGKGKGMDAEWLLPFAHVIKKRFPEMGIGAAGGLGPETMLLVEPLVEDFPNLSIDAQGRLRPSGSALDPIDWKMAEQYLIKAIKLLC